MIKENFHCKTDIYKHIENKLLGFDGIKMLSIIEILMKFYCMLSVISASCTHYHFVF